MNVVAVAVDAFGGSCTILTHALVRTLVLLQTVAVAVADA